MGIVTRVIPQGAEFARRSHNFNADPFMCKSTLRYCVQQLQHVEWRRPPLMSLLSLIGSRYHYTSLSKRIHTRARELKSDIHFPESTSPRILKIANSCDRVAKCSSNYNHRTWGRSELLSSSKVRRDSISDVWNVENVRNSSVKSNYYFSETQFLFS